MFAVSLIGYRSKLLTRLPAKTRRSRLVISALWGSDVLKKRRDARFRVGDFYARR
jgi:hypothetical protein